MYTPVEAVLNPYEPRKWYWLKDFNGYEISEDGYLRSMKHHRKYPYGIMITPKIKGEDPTFELSNNQNERVTVKRSELMKMAFENHIGVSGYPRSTMMTDHWSRNDYHAAHMTRKQKSKQQLDDTPKYAKFTIIG